ncbi:hypothetical protein TrispH2_004240 [Trichoplax sp. H2]|nr:hypothetical protein TrispH2_004240 [Trichoplax sp. H2]|eukprot:RDD43950.1 hypothetical protein TrispH2_004240 [Trichoplax sp. H2]
MASSAFFGNIFVIVRNRIDNDTEMGAATKMISRARIGIRVRVRAKSMGRIGVTPQNYTSGILSRVKTSYYVDYLKK